MLTKNEIKKRIKEIKDYALENDVPIVLDGGLEIILDEIKKINAKKILEVGCAIAYSSINMALSSDDIIVHTIERNEKMYNKAIENVKRMELEDRIKIFYADALELDDDLLFDDYDLIFVDAAKAQYIKFFEKYEKHLRIGGIIISDNLAFHGLAEKWREGDNSMSRDLRALMRKVNKFIDWLKANDKYETTFYDQGDGVAVSKKINL